MTRDMTWCTSVHMLMLLILGMADTAYFLNDILDPKSARFPAFELWCTPAWYCYVWGMYWWAMYRWVYYCYIFWSGTSCLFVTAMPQDRLLVAPLRYFLYFFGDQSSNYDGVFILFSILLYFCLHWFNIWFCRFTPSGVRDGQDSSMTSHTTATKQLLMKYAVLGQGASGTVHAALHIPTFTLVAVKEIRWFLYCIFFIFCCQRFLL